MSTNVFSHLLNDVRSLVTRLHDRDKLTDDLIQQTQKLNEKIRCMKEYEDASNYTSLRNSANPSLSLSQLIANNLQQENRQIKLLQADNLQLKNALQQHQSTLDMIMNKYRRQILELSMESRSYSLSAYTEDLNSQTATDRQKLCQVSQMIDIAKRCLQMGEQASHRDQLDLASLRAENIMLRQLLRFSAQNDSSALKEFLEFINHKQNLDTVLNESSESESPKSSNEDQHTPTRESINSASEAESIRSFLNRRDI